MPTTQGSSPAEPDGGELVEALARNAHEQWAGWMEYFLDKCAVLDDGTVVVDARYAAALRKQMGTPYADLAPEEQDADREQARVQLEIVRGVVFA